MSWINYFVWCLIISALVAFVIIYVPGVAERIEAELLQFLSTNAR